MEQYNKEKRVKDGEEDTVDKVKAPKLAEIVDQTGPDDSFTKLLENLTIPEHKLGVFECSVSNQNANVNWYINSLPISGKKYQVLNLGLFRRLNIRNCLLNENDSLVTCKWGTLETSAKLYVTGTFFQN